MSIVHAYRQPGIAVLLDLRFDGEGELEVVHHIGQVFGCLEPMYRPRLVEATLDSFEADEFGLPEGGRQVSPIGGLLVARGCTEASTFLQHPIGTIEQRDTITPDVIEVWLRSLVSGATSLGAGRPGVASVYTPVAAARLPDRFVGGRELIELVNEDGISRAIRVDPEGWAVGPSMDGLVPAPLKVRIDRSEWKLMLDLDILWDTFAPPNEPLTPELQERVDCLSTLGWTKGE